MKLIKLSLSTLQSIFHFGIPHNHLYYITLYEVSLLLWLEFESGIYKFSDVLDVWEPRRGGGASEFRLQTSDFRLKIYNAHSSVYYFKQKWIAVFHLTQRCISKVIPHGMTLSYDHEKRGWWELLPWMFVSVRHLSISTSSVDVLEPGLKDKIFLSWFL